MMLLRMCVGVGEWVGGAPVVVGEEEWRESWVFPLVPSPRIVMMINGSLWRKRERGEMEKARR